ncbi:MAG: LytTR family DNA-binding domain-containing protein [bacterium]
MLRCIIVDDEIGSIDILSEYIEQTSGLECVTSFRDSVEALNFIMQNDVDLLFLDIDMPNLSGMQIADLIREKNILVIFCTAYSEFAVDSYEREAADYLLKPIAYDRFIRAIEKARKLLHQMKDISKVEGVVPHKLFIKSGSKIHQLDTKNLLYMKKEGHYIVFHTTRGELLSRMNVKELLDSLPQERYARIHKSYVIALDKIDTIQKYDVIIAGKEIPIGDKYKNAFLEKIRYSGT